MPTSTLVYRIDGQDRIVSVSDSWNAFAMANDGADVVASRVVGRNLFDFIVDPTTQALYRKMLVRIRGGRSFGFRYRCDAPAVRRLMEMELRQTDMQGGVEFRSGPVEEVARESLSLPQAAGSPGGGPVAPQRACGWCNRLDVEGEWLEIEEALPRLRLLERPSAPLTHGICEECLARVLESLKEPAQT